jgi:hypothetical protein
MLPGIALRFAIFVNICQSAQSTFVSSLNSMNLARASSKNYFIPERMITRCRIETRMLSPSCFASEHHNTLLPQDSLSLESSGLLRLRGGGLQRAWRSSSGSFRSEKKHSGLSRGLSASSTGPEPLPEDTTVAIAGQGPSSSWANIVAGGNPATPSSSGNTETAKRDDKNYTNGEGDAYYFNSYSHFGIHEEMLKDEVAEICKYNHLRFSNACRTHAFETLS